MDYILEATGITKIFPGVVALNEVDFACKKGTVHCIVGENGAGKSTFVKVLTGIYHPEKGNVKIEDKSIFENPEIINKVAYVPQELQLFEYMTVGENLLLPFKRKGLNRFYSSKSKIFKMAAPLLEKFHVAEKAETSVNDISPSSKQLSLIHISSLDEKTDITSNDKAIRENGITFLKKCVEEAAKLGSDVIGGVIYAPWGLSNKKGRTREEWEICKESLFKVAEFAKDYKVFLALEPVNRFESHFLNTAEEAKTLINEINHPQLKIHLDTFQMNVEENHLYDAIKTCLLYTSNIIYRE